MKRSGLLAVVLSLTLVASCAKRAFPPGGPQDTTPPHIVRLSPASGTVNVPLSSEIAIEFSERMNKRSVETGIVVSPPIRWKKRYWRRNTYVMVPMDSLRANTTYIVGVWGKARDAHGVRMEQTFIGGFSTGSNLGDGRIEGYVMWRNVKVEAALVELFDAGEDFAGGFPEREPVSIVFSGAGGHYEIPFVDTTGIYRLIAFVDEDANLTYDEPERIGCYPDNLVFEGASGLENVDVVVCPEGLGGVISGKVDSTYGIIVTSVQDSSLSYVAFGQKRGMFEITCVRPGQYVGRIFLDRNSNHKFDASDSTVIIIPDTLRVRACKRLSIERSR